MIRERVFNRNRDVNVGELRPGDILRWRSASNKLVVESINGDQITVGWFDKEAKYSTLTRPSIMFVEWAIDDKENYDE